jgi:hypothetical protein
MILENLGNKIHLNQYYMLIELDNGHQIEIYINYAGEVVIESD